MNRFGTVNLLVSGYDYKIVTIPENWGSALINQKDEAGKPIRDLSTIVEEVRDSLSYQIVPVEELSQQERIFWERKTDILNMLGPMPPQIQEVKSIDFAFDRNQTLGLWQRKSGTILIARSQLRSLAAFSGTLLHERAHASSGRPDVDREFELELTRYIGSLAEDLIQQQPSHKDMSELSVTAQINPEDDIQARSLPPGSSDASLVPNEGLIRVLIKY